MINIMYHYVRPNSNEYPKFNSLNVKTFGRQLDFFKKKYGFLSREDYQKAVQEGRNLQGAILTFDDGLRDHYDYVLPELKKRGLWGLFYVATGAYQKHELLGVHRVHYLKGKFGSKAILEKALKNIDNSMLDYSLIEEFDKEIYTSSQYTEDEKKLRRLLNFYLSYEYRDTILDQLMEEFFDEKSLFKEVYLSINEIQELVSLGNIVGAHSVSHKVLSRLSYYEQYDEINDSFEFIESIAKQDYKSFCYPYGYLSSYNTNTLKILNELKVDDACVFDNKIQGHKIKKYELSRIDCNQFLKV